MGSFHSRGGRGALHNRGKGAVQYWTAVRVPCCLLSVNCWLHSGLLRATVMSCIYRRSTALCCPPPTHLACLLCLLPGVGGGPAMEAASTCTATVVEAPVKSQQQATVSLRRKAPPVPPLGGRQCTTGNYIWWVQFTVLRLRLACECLQVLSLALFFW